MLKFDVIVANPPYKGGKHMKFLNDSYEKLNDKGHLIFLHPATNFIHLRYFCGSRNESDKMIFSEKEIVSLEFLSPKIFTDIAQFVPLSITNIIKGSNNDGIKVKLVNDDKFIEFKKLNRVNLFGNIPAIYSLINKFNGMDNVPAHNIKTKNKLVWFVEFSGIRGNVESSTLYTILSNDVKPTKILERNFKHFTYGFKTEAEAYNFITYLKTNFARRLVSLLKYSNELRGDTMMLIPWLDFTKTWTDDKLFKNFKLSDNQIEFINSIPNYYE